jgi:acetyltransferase-like isoleucine patch superfamily enzyme
MLRHTHYNHFDATLLNDRQRAEKACARFNAALGIDSGLNEEEVRGLMWKVLDPRRDTTHRFASVPGERGELGMGVRVETGFSVSYGYNLRISDSVYIGKDVSIDDAGKVEIGARSWIGSGTRILTSDVSKDLVDRKGPAGRWIAADVVVESGVVVGSGCVIYPGVRLGRGCTVEHGSVVRESLGENMVQRAAVGVREYL